MASYSAWFALEEEVPEEDLERGFPQGMARYIRHTGGTPYNHVQQLIRLRTGAHHLAMHTLKLAGGADPVSLGKTDSVLGVLLV